MKIRDILYEIDNQQIFVPAFQREYVWSRDDAKSLIDSLLKEYPTGTMLTWKTSSPPELKRQKYDTAQGAVKLILDGQQRITTLYMLIRGEIPPYYTKSEIVNDIRGLHVQVMNLELSYYQQVQMRNDPYWVDLTRIFKGEVRLSTLRRQLREQGIDLSDDQEDRIEENLRKIEMILEREFREQVIPGNATIRDAIDIFYKVNASGIALTDAELALAQISGYWPQARLSFKKKLVKLAENGFVLKLDFVVYALLGCLYHASMSKDLQRLHSKDNDKQIRQAWDVLNNEVLDYVANFLHDRAYVDHTDEINSIYALIPIIVFFYDRRGQTVSEEQLNRIAKWFYCSQVRGRYVGQMQTKLHKDLQVVQESSRPFEELLAVIAEEERDLTIMPSEFVGRGTVHPLFGLMRWYFKSRNARCFTTGLSIRKKMGKKYQLEYDHIFPWARLRDAGYTRDNRLKYALAQELTNRAILTRVANRRKSARSAKEYLAETRGKFPDALEKQSIPPNEELWEIDRYEDFLQARRHLLAEQLNRFLEELTAPNDEDAAGAMTLAELIADGENEELEFKSSLRWDYRAGEISKALEAVATKTVAALANAGGGMLLIGINDDGCPKGLGNDYASLSGDKDKFERHLRALLGDQFGDAFVASGIKIDFPVVGDVEICQVDVARAQEPLWTTVRDKHGQAQEKLYVRNGNASQELVGDDLSDYLKQHFS